MISDREKKEELKKLFPEDLDLQLIVFSYLLYKKAMAFADIADANKDLSKKDLFDAAFHQSMEAYSASAENMTRFGLSYFDSVRETVGLRLRRSDD